MPRGHTSWHFPQSIHLATSSARPFVSPRWISRLIFRGLKLVNRAAEQVAFAYRAPHRSFAKGKRRLLNRLLHCACICWGSMNSLLRLVFLPLFITLAATSVNAEPIGISPRPNRLGWKGTARWSAECARRGAGTFWRDHLPGCRWHPRRW